MTDTLAELVEEGELLSLEDGGYMFGGGKKSPARGISIRNIDGTVYQVVNVRSGQVIRRGRCGR